jgi:fucose 4-O-acetylase-like acetyltransferase
MKRDYHLDTVKGLAVIAMSFVHVNIFFLNTSNAILDSITKWGAISCFSAFLLISGILVGKSISNKKKPSWFKTAKKLFFIYLVYLIIGLLSWYVTQGSLSISEIDRIIILKELPLLSEYLINFLLLYLLLKVCYGCLERVSKSIILTILVSVGIYALGHYLYSIDFLNNVWFKGLFVGIGDYHYFPLFQYLPIYLLGIYLGRKSKTKYYIYAFVVVLMSYFAIKIFNLTPWRRFPPSLLFLTQSLLIPLSILALLKGFKVQRRFKVIEHFAKNSLLSLLLLTVITLLSALFLPQNTNILFVWGINIGVLVITAVLLQAYKKTSKMI